MRQKKYLVLVLLISAILFIILTVSLYFSYKNSVRQPTMGVFVIHETESYCKQSG